MSDKCVTCAAKADHFLGYGNLNTTNGWEGLYCTKCFIKKLRGMATTWRRENENRMLGIHWKSTPTKVYIILWNLCNVLWRQ